MAADGRSTPELSPVPGLFARHLPVVVEFAGTSFAAFSQGLERHWGECLDWQDYFSWDLVEAGGKGGSDHTFSFAFEWVAPPKRFTDGGLTLDIVREGFRGEGCRLELLLTPDGAGWQGEIRYDTEAVPAAEAETLAGCWLAVLASAAAAPAARLDELAVLAPKERQRLLVDLNATGLDHPGLDVLPQLFERRAAATPEQVALVAGERSLTYAELDALADRIAAHLHASGVAPEERVALCVERSVEMVAALLGILKAGGAYVPLDPEYPTARLSHILNDCRAAVLLTQPHLAEQFPGFAGTVVLLDEALSAERPEPPASAATVPNLDSLAYVIYTSGSSGRPKGVMVSHGAIVNRLLWMIRRFPLDERDAVLQKTSLSFDASIWELFVPLLSGARLVLARPGGQQDSSYLVQTVLAQEITVLQLVPSLLGVFLDDVPAQGCPSLRRLFCGGEELHSALVRAYFARLQAELCNLYGPTEAAIDATFYPCAGPEPPLRIPIGRPIDNVQVYILSPGLQPVPAGVSGQLFIGGRGLARGYFGRPDLTAERFLPDPFAEVPGARLYATGDLARHDEGGVVFLGRVDHQIKIRGVRIEMGEVESAIREHPSVSQAVVVSRPTEGGEVRLVAYVVLRKAGEPQEGFHRLPGGLEVAVLNPQEADYIYREVFEEESYLQHGVTLRDGDTVFDVGANIGLFSLFVHQRCPGAKVFAFEPVPPTFEQLRLNLEGQGVDARLFFCGLASRAGTAEVTFYPAWSGMSGMYADAEEDEEVARAYLRNQDESLLEHAAELLAGRFRAERYACALRTLSEVIAEEGVERIDLLKIDVEKSELEVLQGISDADWPKIKQAVLEVHDIEGRIEQITALLASHGFMVEVERGGLLAGTGLANLYAVYPSRLTETRPVSTPRVRAAEPPAPLAEFLAARLPSQMVPAALVFIDALPLTPNGKLDRLALPDPDAGRPAMEEEGPRTEVEEVVAGVWCEVLDLPRVGVHAGFFDLGGHSLLATRLVSRLRRIFNADLSMRNLFDSPTVAALAAMIEGLLRSSAGQLPPPIVRVARDGPLLTSFSQRRLWFLNQLDPDSAAYHIPAAIDLAGDLDVAALRASFAAIIERHEVLRTRFVLRGAEPEQVVDTEVDPLPRIDLRPLPPAVRQDEAARLTVLLTRTPFDLTAERPLRLALLWLAPGEHRLVAVQHHIASDGWSTGILLRELAALYEAGRAGRPAALPELPVQYADFAHWQRTWLQGEVLEVQLDYWRRDLGSSPPPLELPTDRPRPRVQSQRGDRSLFQVPAVVADGLRALGRRQGASLFMTLAAALGLLLERYTGQDDLALGTPVSGRQLTEVENLIGFFVNTLVLRVRLDGDPTFAGLLQQVRDRALGAFVHQDLPFEKLVEELHPERDLSRSPLFQVMLVAQQEEMRLPELPGLALRFADVENRTAKFDQTFFVESVEGGLAGSIEYNRDLFDRVTISRLGRQWVSLLTAVSAGGELRVTQLPLLTDDERHQLLWAWNDTALPPPSARSLHGLFEAQAVRCSDAVAVVGGGRRLTYRQLDRLANRLARRLAAQGVGLETPVGISLARSPELLVGLLAILKAGGAFLPLDPGLPEARQLAILADAGVEVMVADAAVRARLAGGARPLVFCDPGLVDGEAVEEEPLPSPASPESLAYIIYTSGSTGIPNGVMVEHRGILNYLSWCVEAYHVAAGEGAPAHSSIGFDLTLTSLFAPLAVGRAVTMVDEDRSLEALGAVLSQGEGFSFVKVTPAHLELLAEQLSPVGAERLTRYLIVGGETLRGEALAFWAQHAPATRVVNEYGPTETVVGCTVYEADAGAVGPGAVPIGRPIANTRAYLLSPALEVVPVGAVGELYVGGAGVARGYLGQPAMTAGKFIPDGLSGEPGARLYRTGDLARRRADGALEYLGRCDHQIKVRGFRIEPGEVESVLREHAAVGDCAVLAAGDRSGTQRLVAYFVPAAIDPPEPGELAEFLGARLPAYMVPWAFAPLSSLPLTANGKLDRRALPVLESPGGGRSESYEAPRSAVQQAIAAIWQEVLGVERVGLHDRFFDLGGHSLLLIRVRSRLEQTFGRKISMLDLFRHTTVAALADLVRSPQPAAAADGATPAVQPARCIDLAVIGMACRFPGAPDIETFWSNLREGVESIVPWTEEELRQAGIPASHLANPAYVRAAGALLEVGMFDAGFFGFSPREAEITDPQQRLFLECAWEALEDAGHADDAPAKRIGVYGGVGVNRYWLNLSSLGGGLDPSTARQAVIGNDKDYLATRVSYKLDLRGPSIGVQTACSTSLVAVHLACQGLLAGECDLALAGGASVDPVEKGGYFYEEGGSRRRTATAGPFRPRRAGRWRAAAWG